MDDCRLLQTVCKKMDYQMWRKLWHLEESLCVFGNTSIVSSFKELVSNLIDGYRDVLCLLRQVSRRSPPGKVFSPYQYEPSCSFQDILDIRVVSRKSKMFLEATCFRNGSSSKTVRQNAKLTTKYSVGGFESWDSSINWGWWYYGWVQK